jgi:hypothetical protein
MSEKPDQLTLHFLGGAGNGGELSKARAVFS